MRSRASVSPLSQAPRRTLQPDSARLLALAIKLSTDSGINLAEIGEELGVIGGLALVVAGLVPIGRRAATVVAGIAHSRLRLPSGGDPLGPLQLIRTTAPGLQPQAVERNDWT